MLVLRVRESWVSVQGCAKLPMKQRKDWKEKVVKNTRPIMTARASSSNFERSCNSKLFQSWWSCHCSSRGGCVAAPIWPHGALRRSFWWSLNNDVSDSISLSQAVLSWDFAHAYRNRRPFYPTEYFGLLGLPESYQLAHWLLYLQCRCKARMART